jgi:hypothetical protein
MYFNTGQRYNKGDDIYAKNGFLKWESTKGWYSPAVEGFETQSSSSGGAFWKWAAFITVIVLICLILWHQYKK